MQQVFVVRHAQSFANLDARLSSAEPGPALTDWGHQQCVGLGQYLAARNVSKVYTSPLLRARTTADYIAKPQGVDVEVLAELREFGLGDWEGRPGTDGDVAAHPVFSAWVRGEDLGHQFQGDESALDLRARFSTALQRVLDDSLPGPAALVTHGGLMAVALPLVASSDTGVSGIPVNAGIRELVHHGDRWMVATSGDPMPWTAPDTVLGG